MQVVTSEQLKTMSSTNARQGLHRLFETYWDDVAPLNNYSPEAARALLSREGHLRETVIQLDTAFGDPWIAVRLALRERAAGRSITRTA